MQDYPNLGILFLDTLDSEKSSIFVSSDKISSNKKKNNISYKNDVELNYVECYNYNDKCNKDNSNNDKSLTDIVNTFSKYNNYINIIKDAIKSNYNT